MIVHFSVGRNLCSCACYTPKFYLPVIAAVISSFCTSSVPLFNFPLFMRKCIHFVISFPEESMAPAGSTGYILLRKTLYCRLFLLDCRHRFSSSVTSYNLSLQKCKTVKKTPTPPHTCSLLLFTK